MRRVEHEEDGLPGQDSFLDVIANMVGILIILVMVVAARATQGAGGETELAAAPPPSVAPRLQQELDAALRTLRDSEREVEQSLAQAVNLRREAVVAEARRSELNVLLAAVEQEVEERLNKLDDVARASFDVQREIGQKRIELNDLTQEQLSLLDGPAEVEEVESVPTPLARTVTGDEIHVRLRGRRLAVIPVDALLAELRGSSVDYLRTRLSSGGEGVDVFGPIDEFRMRLSLQVEVETLPGASPLTTPPRRSLVQAAEFLPTRSDVGIAVEQALLPGAPLMQALRARRANHPAVVLWTYPDSFGDIRTIKRAMWEQDVPLAVRPLEADSIITFSTRGSKAQAQ